MLAPTFVRSDASLVVAGALLALCALLTLGIVIFAGGTPTTGVGLAGEADRIEGEQKKN